jgi:hypothetical protein
MMCGKVMYVYFHAVSNSALRLCVCMLVTAFVGVYVSACVYASVCLLRYVYVCLYVYVCVCVCMQACVFV